MISFKVFRIAFFSSLAIAILAGVFVSIVVPWPGLVMMWVLIIFGFGLYWRAHVLTRQAAALKGIGVEQNPTTKQFLRAGKFQLTLIIILAVQLVFGAIASLIYFAYGLFYTMFLTAEVVFFAFIMLDWLNDELEMQRFKASTPSEGTQARQ